MLSAATNAALLLIDLQKGFDDPVWGTRNNPQMEARIGELLARWRTNHRLVIHAKHMSSKPTSPLRPCQPGNDFKVLFTPLPAERVIEKRVNSCFIGTALESELRDLGVQGLVVVGLTTDHCVSTTVRMSQNLGFQTWVVSDATATFDRTGPNGQSYAAQQMHAAALCELHGEFATIQTTQQILRETYRMFPANSAQDMR